MAYMGAQPGIMNYPRHLGAAAYLPPNILSLFAPRPLPEYKPIPEKKRPLKLSGMAEFVDWFETRDTYEAIMDNWTKPETREQKKARILQQKLDKSRALVEERVPKWDPTLDTKIDGDAYKTLFVGRMSYLTDEHKLKREMEQFGPVKKIKLIYDLDGKPRGYGFVEFEHERDMHAAYKQGDGMKVDGRRILVDVERGRTVKAWRPRRLGGGLGNTREKGGKTHPYREERPSRRERERERERSRYEDRDRRDRDYDRRDDRYVQREFFSCF